MVNRRLETAEAVLTALREEFDEFSAQLQVAARFIIDSPREVGVQSMRALAVKAEVHPNTLVRLAQAVGFDGYDAMRERFRDFMIADGLGGYRDRAQWLKAMARRGGTAEVLAEMASSTMENLDSMWQRQNARTLEEVADLVLAADRVYVLGVGSAYSLAHHFWYVARMGFDHILPIPRHGSQPIDDLAHVQATDLIIALTFQPYRMETLQAVEFAQSKGATIIGISDSLISPLAKHSTHLLVSPTHTPHFFESHAAIMAMLEALTAILVARAGDDADQRIDEFHKHRFSAGLYADSASRQRMN